MKKEFIKEKLVAFYSKCGVDRYGQVGTLTLYEVFKNDTEEVKKYLDENKEILDLGTYGGAYGQYKGFRTIIDNDIKIACDKALESNPNYQRVMTSW